MLIVPIHTYIHMRIHTYIYIHMHTQLYTNIYRIMWQNQSSSEPARKSHVWHKYMVNILVHQSSLVWERLLLKNLDSTFPKTNMWTQGEQTIGQPRDTEQDGNQDTFYPSKPSGQEGSQLTSLKYTTASLPVCQSFCSISEADLHIEIGLVQHRNQLRWAFEVDTRTCRKGSMVWMCSF